MLEFPTELRFPEIVPFAVLILFLVAFIIQMIYYWGVFRAFAFYTEKGGDNLERPVSVVICARNEYQNLKKYLPVILDQDYPEYEVIVVNDVSDDSSADLLDYYAKRFGNLKVINLNQNLNFFEGKKFPLSIGIKSAAHNLILLTDADCVPASNQWIRKMQSKFDEKTEIVLGYGAHEKENNFLNALIRYDTLLTAMQYFAYALVGKPYMGVGRNLAYRRELFYREKGFSSHYRISSGDDDLFINKVARKRNTKIEVSRQSFTVSRAKESMRDWFIQKRRHFTTSNHYRSSTKFILGLYYLSKFIFFGALIALLIILYNWIIVLGSLLIYETTLLVIIKNSADRLDESDLFLFSPFLDVFLLILHPFVYLSNAFSRPEKWK